MLKFIIFKRTGLHSFSRSNHPVPSVLTESVVFTSSGKYSIHKKLESSVTADRTRVTTYAIQEYKDNLQTADTHRQTKWTLIVTCCLSLSLSLLSLALIVNLFIGFIWYCRLISTWPCTLPLPNSSPPHVVYLFLIDVYYQLMSIYQVIQNADPTFYYCTCLIYMYKHKINW